MIRHSVLLSIALFSLVFLLSEPLREQTHANLEHIPPTESETIQNEQEESFVFIPVPLKNEDEAEEGENVIEVFITTDEQTVASSDQLTENFETVTEEKYVSRPEALYNFPPVSFDEINLLTRDAIVNILCNTGTASISPISASGVLIHHSGVILTNAHVGQYLLLEQDPRISISCEVRVGSPARSAYDAELVYLPPAWVNEHANQISEFRPLGTGEHDWAILRITNRIDDGPLPVAFPFLSPEIRETAGFIEDSVLLASYPAGFIDGATVQNNLYAASTITTIKKLYTFSDGSVDLLSLGGVIVAQGGSSGGAVVNAWNQLIGIIVTSSDAESTSDRDLRAITLAHVNRSMKNQIGIGLTEFLSSDIQARGSDFRINIAPSLADMLIAHLR